VGVGGRGGDGDRGGRGDGDGSLAGRKKENDEVGAKPSRLAADARHSRCKSSPSNASRGSVSAGVSTPAHSVRQAAMAAGITKPATAQPHYEAPRADGIRLTKRPRKTNGRGDENNSAKSRDFEPPLNLEGASLAAALMIVSAAQ